MGKQINLQISKSFFNEAYYPFLFDYNTRFEVYYGGAASGKSHFVFQKIILKALMEPRKVLIIRKVARTLKDSVFQMALDTLSRLKLLSLSTINKSTFAIILPNGSQLLFKGIDDGGEKIKSITGITDIVIEEATEITMDEFSQLNLRMRAKCANQQIYLMFNPVSKVNWCYKYFFENGTPKDTVIHFTTYKDNRFLPPDYIESLEAMKETNPTYYRIYALGEFCSLDRLVYPNWEEGPPPSDKTNLKLLCGLDFGYINDESAFIVSWLDEDEKKLYIVDEFYQKGLLNNEIANLIKYGGYAKELIIADSAEAKSIEEIKREGIPRIRAAAKGKGSILQGIQKLQQFKLVVSPKCENTLVELQNYTWKKDKKTGEYVNEPIDSFNHCLDALRYSLQCIDNKQKVKTLNKALLGL